MDSWTKVGRKRWIMIEGLRGGVYRSLSEPSLWKFRGLVVRADSLEAAKREFAELLTSKPEESDPESVEWVCHGKGMVRVGDLRGKLYRNPKQPNQWRWKDYVFTADSPLSAIDHLIKQQHAAG